MSDTLFEGKPKEVIVLSDKLPPEGEDDFRIECGQASTSLTLMSNRNDLVTITFRDVLATCVSRFPGAEVLRIRNERSSSVGEVIEYVDSDASRAWNDSVAWLKGGCRHFQVILLGVNRRIEVFSVDVTVS